MCVCCVCVRVHVFICVKRRYVDIISLLWVYLCINSTGGCARTWLHMREAYVCKHNVITLGAFMNKFNRWVGVYMVAYA
jgi:hypothetical protein